MSEKSAIEWCDATWNVTLGCTKVSAGCRGCYAIPQAWMKQHNPNEKIAAAYEGLVEKVGPGAYNWTGRVNLLPERLPLPLTWTKPQRIFVTSLSDLFHEAVPDEFIDQVFAIMAATPHHTYQVLTKRPERMAAYVNGVVVDGKLREGILGSLVTATGGDLYGKGVDPLWLIQIAYKAWPWPLPNVWLGTSVEDQKAADERIPHLLMAPAAVRFLSCEPLLGPVDLTIPCPNCADRVLSPFETCMDCLPATQHVINPGDRGSRRVIPEEIGWVIGGGESGPNFRPLDLDWARSLRDQCAAAGVPFLFKQVGGRTSGAGGRLLDGQEHNEFPAPIRATAAV